MAAPIIGNGPMKIIPPPSTLVFPLGWYNIPIKVRTIPMIITNTPTVTKSISDNQITFGISSIASVGKTPIPYFLTANKPALPLM